MRTVSRFAAVIAVSGLVLALVALALAPITATVLSANEAEADEINLDPLAARSYVYAADGSLIATLHGEENREPIALGDVPDHVVDAILAVEDDGFYAHDGVNLRATLRALLENVDEGEVEQGGSTITQQLVKQAIVGNERSLERKTREAVLARRLEDEMSKDEILERYLNSVYFGNGAYGVQAAAETYWGIDAADLTVGQAALLAGMIRAPNEYDPVRKPERARARRAVALGRLVKVGVITAVERATAAAEPLPQKIRRILPPPDDYFVEEVKQQLLDDERLGATRDEREQAVFRGGLRIHTTFDPRAQRLAVQARDEVLATIPGGANGQFPLAPDPLTGAPRFGTASIVSVDPATGGVRAMVGGPGFKRYKYNLATQNARQPGSAFKVFVLMALLENGFVPNDSVSGSGPCTFRIPGLPEPYRVENFGGSGGGGGSILSQTLRSSNCAYVRLGQIVGLDEVVRQARKMGITTPLDASFFSMPLGSMEVLPTEMAAAYAAVPNDGLYNRPYLVDRVEDGDGDVLFTHERAATRAFSVQSARLAAEILEQNVLSGTGTAARIPGRDAGGKTGTAQDSTNAWFVGFTKQLTTAVWMGGMGGQYEMRIFGRGVTGGSFPAQMWGRYMRAWHEGVPVVDFAEPEPTRGGRYLSVDRRFDPRAGSSYSSYSGSRYRSGSGSSGGSTATTGTTEATVPATTTTVDRRPRKGPTTTQPPIEENDG